MSYVEVCQKHGQHHTEICGECHDELKAENAHFRESLKKIINLHIPHEDWECRLISKRALEGKK